ncbi:hypothetical protein [Pseudovibrio denitrificans]|uniref:hypothetical protein n=1 Tax=Pseudovibrio denitrificans TaxID=258256 RepID=UPI0013E31D24|nr:hypothetical protein [Pseudovibrio denitrificans]
MIAKAHASQHRFLNIENTATSFEIQLNYKSTANEARFLSDGKLCFLRDAASTTPQSIGALAF